MYANLNTSEKLVVEPSKMKGYRFFYKVVNKEYGSVVFTRHSNRKFVAATISGSFFGTIEKAKTHREEMIKTGAGDLVAQGFYCYLEDLTPFATENVLSGPKLAYSYNKAIEYVG